MAVVNPNVDVFDLYFRREDLNGDGRIDGQEAICIIKFSIWAFADKNRTGFLGRPELYNALKLITPAQEVLKQVWDFSDQDIDTVLSLRKFCIALYLMERYRERRPLPSVLPSNIMSDLPGAV